MADASMIYSGLKIHQKNWMSLVRAVSGNRLHHSLLFHGPAGVGKTGHAIELAALLNCEKPGSSRACGQCPACRKIKTFQHGNVQVVLPYPRNRVIDKNSSSLKALSNDNLDLLRQQMSELGKNPYFKMELPKANTILINSIRELRRDIYLSIPDKGSRVILILSAEKLCIPNPASANSLLKILEEPPDNTYFFLMTSKPDQLLETIISRCQKFYFPALSQKVIEKYLVEKKINESDARLIAKMCNGNIHLADNYKNNVLELYDDVKTILNAAFTRNPEIWAKFLTKVQSLKIHDTTGLEYFFGTGIYAFRDLLMLAQLSDISRIIFQENVEKYKKLLQRYPQVDWSKCISLMEDALIYLKANGQVPLVINAMLMEMSEVIHSENIG